MLNGEKGALVRLIAGLCRSCKIQIPQSSYDGS
jgi:hypothetical protein